MGNRTTTANVLPDDVAEPKFQEAFALLLKARRYAERTNSNLWEFAVEIQQMRALGLSDNDLRFLVRSRCLEHAREVSAGTRKNRQFRMGGLTTFVDSTCFVMTQPAAVEVADALTALDQESTELSALRLPQIKAYELAQDLPLWRPDRRVLSWRGRIVKQFRRKAANQELVLAAFQEENWPLRIFDPLAPQEQHEAKRRLNSTIKCLNQGQEHALMHFRGDGTGEGVLWEPAI